MRPIPFSLAGVTAVGSVGLAAGGTAGALIAGELTGGTASAGLPLGAVVVGSGIGAVLIARVARHADRIAGLALGYVIGALGAGLVVVATMATSFGLVVAGNVVMGVANAAVFLTRYAAAEAVPKAARGRAVGVVLAGAAVGAVAAANLLGAGGDLAAGLGLPRLTGLYLVAVVAFAVAGVLLAVLRGRTRGPAIGGGGDETGPAPHTRRRASTGTAVLVLATTNLMMVAVMAMAPLHLVAHGHNLDIVGFVVSIHVLCMLAPAPLAGWLADRAGAPVVAGLGATLLAVAGASGALTDADSAVGLAVVLGVLGLGWCAGVVAGSVMLADSLPAAERPRAEGVGEMAMGIAAGVGAPLAGLVVAFGGFPTLVSTLSVVSVVALLRGAWTVGSRATRRSPGQLTDVPDLRERSRRPAESSTT